MTNTLPAFPTAEVTVHAGNYTVPCEPIAPGLAITACFTLDGPDADNLRPILGGGFYITHLPTSRIIPDNQSCIECCRAAGRLLAEMELDWSTVDMERSQTLVASLEGRDKELLAKAVHTIRRCSQRACWHDEDETITP